MPSHKSCIIVPPDVISSHPKGSAKTRGILATIELLLWPQDSATKPGEDLNSRSACSTKTDPFNTPTCKAARPNRSKCARPVWSSPIGWPSLNVSACWASALLSSCFLALLGDSARRCAV